MSTLLTRKNQLAMEKVLKNSSMYTEDLYKWLLSTLESSQKKITSAMKVCHKHHIKNVKQLQKMLQKNELIHLGFSIPTLARLNLALRGLFLREHLKTVSSFKKLDVKELDDNFQWEDNVPPWTTETLKFSTKKKIVEYLHSTCNDEFLTFHKLKGEVKSIKKTRRVPELHDTYNEFLMNYKIFIAQQD